MNYTYSVDVDPIFLIAAPLIAALLFLWPRRAMTVEENVKVDRFRPLIALYIDTFFIVIISVPLFLFPLALEYIATGSWAWSVKRNFARPTDIIIIVQMIFIFWVVNYYIKWCFGKGIQTIGQYFMRFHMSKTNKTEKVGWLQYFTWVLNFSFPKLAQLFSWKQSIVAKNMKIQKVKTFQK